MACRALCIGVSRHEAVRPDLPGAEHDAEDVAALLARHGFITTVLKSPSGEDAHDALEALVAACGDSDRVVVLLSGHGCMHENDNYLLPADFGAPKAHSGVLKDTARCAIAVHGDIVAPLQRKNKLGLTV